MHLLSSPNMFISIENLSNAHSDFITEIMIPQLYRDRKMMAQPQTEMGGTASKDLRQHHSRP